MRSRWAGSVESGDAGGLVFECDKPSSLFGQFCDEQVSAIARPLDVALEIALKRAKE